MTSSIRYLVGVLAILFYSSTVLAQLSGGGEANPNLSTNQEALKAFQDKRFGMFIHWGPVALRGEEISWSRGVNIPIDEYDNLYHELTRYCLMPQTGSVPLKMPA